MSEVKATDVAVVYSEDGPAHSLVRIEATDAAGEAVQEPKWYPLIPIGHFTHMAYGEFSVTTEDAAQIVAHFTEGIPLRGGIPIDEDGAHQEQAAAFGYIDQLEVREDGVWGLIALSSLGRTAIADNQVRYLSPSFAPAGRAIELPDGAKYENVLIAAALCNRPFFKDQPGLLAATVGYEFETIQAAQARAQANDVEVIAVTDEQKAALRTAYEAAKGEVTDEEWTTLTAELESDEAWAEFAKVHGLDVEAPVEPPAEAPAETPTEPPVEPPADELPENVSISRAELEKLQADAEKSKDLETKVEEVGKELEAVQATTGTLTAQLEKSRLEQVIRATDYGGLAPGPAAVNVLVALQMNPCEQTVKATMAHLAEHKGALGLVALGESEPISATDGSGGNQELWLEQKGLAPDIVGRVQQIATKESCSLQEAYDKHQRVELGLEV